MKTLRIAATAVALCVSLASGAQAQTTSDSSPSHAVTVARETDGGRAVAIAPLYLFSRAPLRVLRFTGHGAGDWLGAVDFDEGHDFLDMMASVEPALLQLFVVLRALGAEA